MIRAPRHIVTLTASVLTALSFCSVASAQMGGPPPTVEFDYDAVKTETLVYQFPEKWKPYSNETDAKRVTMLFPTGQTPQKWDRSLNVTEYLTTAGVTTAAQVKDLKVNANTKKCSAHSVTENAGGPPGGPGGNRPERPERDEAGGPGGDRPAPPPGSRPAPGMENGYSSVSWTENCDGATMLNKVILGNEKLYTMNLTFKSEPRASVIREYTAYLGSVFVCDPKTGQNPCAPLGGPGGGMGGPR